MTIRQARTEDAGDICRINKSALGYEYPENQTRLQLEKILGMDSDRIFIAEIDGETAGYVHAGRYECTYNGGLKNILALAVEERFRGRGAGRLLMRAAEEWAASESCIGVRLVSGLNRTGAHAFYLRCGYSLRKEQKNFIKLF